MESTLASSPCILLVEEDASLQYLLCELLHSEGFTVTVAASLSAVPTQLAEETFLHQAHAVLPHGLVVRYGRLWTTPEGERRREAKVGFFHFRGTQLCQVGFPPARDLLGTGPGRVTRQAWALACGQGTSSAGGAGWGSDSG